MQVKLLTSRAGVGFSQSAGDVIDIDEKEADSLIRAGQAEPVTKIEKATAKKATTKAVKNE